MAVKNRGRGLAEQPFVLVRAARRLVTLRGAAAARRGAEMSALSVIPDGAVLIGSRGLIEEVGPTRRIERLKAARDAVEVDATGLTVLPAFVDSAARPVYGHATGAGLRIGVDSFAGGKRGALEKTALGVLAGMARHGTLAAELLTGYGGDPAGELRLLRIYASAQRRFTNNVASVALTGYVPDDFKGGALAWTRNMAIPLLASASHLRLAQAATVNIGGEAAGMDEAREFLWAAHSHGLATHVQSAPGCSEAAAALALAADARTVQGLEGGLPSLRAALARSAAVLTLTPAVTFAQGREAYVPARAMIEDGAAIALATNFSRETNGNYNMLHTMELACRHLEMSAEQAVTAATINSAYAVGCGAESGSIEPGKRGDLALFECEDLTDLIQNSGVHRLTRVLSRGRTVYRRARVEEPL